MAISLKAMEYFTTALQQGGISKAAAEMNIAASAVGPRTADRTKPPSANLAQIKLMAGRW